MGDHFIQNYASIKCALLEQPNNRKITKFINSKNSLVLIVRTKIDRNMIV